MAKASNNEFPSVLFTDGTADPSAPSASTVRLYFKNDTPYWINSGGTAVAVNAADLSASNLSDLSDVGTATPTDGQVLTYATATSTWEPAAAAGGGGGGDVPGWIAYLNARQTGETSHTDDDFFTDGSLAGTEVTGAGAATWVEKYDRMSVYCSGQGSFPSEIAARVFSLTPSSAPVTLETRFSALWAGDVTVGRSKPAVMVGFSDGTATSSTIVGIYMYSDPGGDGMPAYDIGGTFAAVTSGTVRPEFSDLVQSLVVRVVWTGTNSFSYSTSVDGIHFVEHFTLAQTLTPTHFFVGAGNADTTVPRQVSFDYVRINEADLTGA